MATNSAEAADDTATIPETSRVSTPKAEGIRQEALLDEALAETFPASDPISPAYEARIEAQREAAEQAENARIRRIGTSIATGIASVGAVGAAIWLIRSMARRELDL